MALGLCVSVPLVLGQSAPDRRWPVVPVTGLTVLPIAGCRDRRIVALNHAAWVPRDEVCRRGLALTAEGRAVSGTCQDCVSAHALEFRRQSAWPTRLLGGW